MNNQTSQKRQGVMVNGFTFFYRLKKVAVFLQCRDSFRVSEAIGMTFQNDEAAMADAEKQAEELCGRWMQWLQARMDTRCGSVAYWTYLWTSWI